MSTEVKKFIKNGSLFGAIFIVAILGFNALYIHFVEYKSISWRNYFEFDEYLKNTRHLDFAFFGTSRTRDSMNPQFIPNSLNFSLGSQNYISIYYKYKYYLEKYNLKIDNVVLEIDSNSLSKAFANTDQFMNYDFSPFMSVSEKSSTSNKPITDVFIRSNFPFFGRGLELYGLIREPKTELYLGWAKVTGDWTKNKMDIKSIICQANKEREQLDDLSIQYFIKTVNLAKGKGANIILLMNPHAKDFDDISRECAVDGKEIYKFVIGELDKRQIKYKVVDYYSTLYDSPELFHIDAGHVNYRGAEVISKRFLQDME